MIITPAKLHIETIGSGPHLAFIHGWGMSSAVWQPLVKKLSKHFTLHLIDLPGMGLSQVIAPYHLHALAEKVSEMLPNNIDIVGWSLGGQVAMRIALDQPEVVRNLVLVGSTPCFVNKTGLSTQKHWHLGVDVATFKNFAQSMQTDYHKTMMQFLTLQCMGSRDAGSTVRFLKRRFAERPAPSQHVLQEALTVLLETDLRNEISLLNKPVLLIHGDKDTLAPVQAANWMMQNLPDALLRVIAGASHAPFLSHQDQFTEALVQFLAPQSVRSLHG
jgi:pimeloyl-[acyl-carrier protein] methyl ester esterase